MKVSQSQLKCYKSCRRLYELKYIEGLEYNREIEPLKDGASYHGKIEDICNKGYFTCSGDKTDAMAFAYEKYIYPKLHLLSAEVWFEYPVANGKHTLIGRIDGINKDGIVVEHKTTSSDIDDAYIFGLQWDEQILCYMLATKTTKMYYTVCKKPSIRQKKNETDEEFFERCCQWYDEDTENKIRVIEVERSKEELEQFKVQLEKTIDEMEKCELFYNNTANCTSYGRKCPYSSICLNYDPKLDYIDFTKRERREE